MFYFKSTFLVCNVSIQFLLEFTYAVYVAEPFNNYEYSYCCCWPSSIICL